MPIDKSLRES